MIHNINLFKLMKQYYIMNRDSEGKLIKEGFYQDIRDQKLYYCKKGYAVPQGPTNRIPIKNSNPFSLSTRVEINEKSLIRINPLEYIAKKEYQSKKDKEFFEKHSK